MRWTELRKRTEELFDPARRPRLTVHSTHYSNVGCQCGRGWIAVDGRELAGLNSREAMDPHSPHCNRGPILDSERTTGRLTEPGEFTRFELHDACWELVHSNPHSLLDDERPLVRALAVLHAKVGRNRIERQLATETHPLVRYLIDLRLKSHAVEPAATNSPHAL
jgi:hypothetical protein